MPAGGAAGGVRRSAASPLARLLEAPSHAPITRIRTDMATVIRLTGMAIQPTATVIRPTVTAAMDQAVPAMAMDQAPPVILKVFRTRAPCRERSRAVMHW